MKNFIVVLLIAVSFASCKKSEDPAPAASGELRVGSTWVYKYTDLDAAGTIVSTSNITATITSQVTLGGNQYWVLSGGGSPSYIRKTSTGYYDYINGSAQLKYKIPAVLNDTWRITYSAAVGDYADFTVKAVAQNVTVPFGTVACFYTEGYDSNSLEDKIWYNDANVMVKQEEYDQTGLGALFIDFKVELVSFSL